MEETKILVARQKSTSEVQLKYVAIPQMKIIKIGTDTHNIRIQCGTMWKMYLTLWKPR